MKEKDFNQFLKSSVDDFEENISVDFNQEKVWKNIKVKKRIIWFNILKVACIILLFISIGIWFNSSDPIQIVKKQVKKSTVSPKQNSLENTNIEEPINRIQKSINVYAKNKSRPTNQVEIIIPESTMPDTETFEPEAIKKLITEDKPLIKEPLKTTPEIVYSVEFKRGKLNGNLEETRKKVNVPMISFKRFKKSLIELDTNTVIANSNLSTNNYKLKF